MAAPMGAVGGHDPKGDVAAAAKKIHHRGLGHHSDQRGVADGPPQHVGDVELPDLSGFSEREIRQRGDYQAKRHQPSWPVLIDQVPQERRENSAQPASSGHRQRHRSPAPTGILGDEYLDATHGDLGHAGGPESRQASHRQHQPAVIHGRPGPPGQPLAGWGTHE